ncbi:hypothetical protein ACE939_03415 [Aquimarina sp. W85]|uniref:hypothetical protein n=1 Tax=Aquimarina rhodophyticola TaxID=3342246 RepID=UPI0036721F6A
MLIPIVSWSQTIDNQYVTDIIKGSPFKVNGQMTANSVFYTANRASNRIPLTYFLQGVLNVSSFNFTLPIEYSFSNHGQNLDYELPFNYNSLSLHPSYKSITAHLGTVSMNFSPYTLSDHQFTGVGVDITLPKSWTVSAMGGELRKAIEYNDNPQATYSYQRMGYGIKTEYKKQKYRLGFIGFYAKDNPNSIDLTSTVKDNLPKENLVLSIEGDIKLGKYYTIEAEYASTAITHDIASEVSNSEVPSFAGTFIKNRTSTQYYNALKTRIGYHFKSSSFGIGYEYIDPGYETLGAYFFNNDFENITLNLNNSLFKNKVSLAINAGYQRDNLNKSKANSTNRFVGSVNSQIQLSQKVTLVGSFSNFTTYTKTRLNQFDMINDANILQEQIEAFNYRQLSKSASFSLNYLLTSNENRIQNVSLFYLLNDVANEQNGNVRIGDISSFHNLSAAHSFNIIDNHISINTSFNATYNTVGREESTTWGPTISIGKGLFKNKLNTRFGASYNQSKGMTNISKITNFRINFKYIALEHHNFNLNIIQLYSQTNHEDYSKELTATFGYNYSFEIKKPTIDLKKKNVSKDSINIRYKKYFFEGTPIDITPQLIDIPKKEGFEQLTFNDKKELVSLEKQLLETQIKNNKIYKELAIVYIKKMYDYSNFLEFYNQKILESYKKLILEARRIDRQIRDDYIIVSAKLNSSKQKKQEDLNRQKLLKKRLVAHTMLMDYLISLQINIEDVQDAKGILKDVKQNNMSKIYSMYQNEEISHDAIVDFIEIKLADIFHKVSG